jgi:hypothetical protein
MADDTANQIESKRLKILEADEIEAVYGLPVFDDNDRAFYFELSPPERAIFSRLRGIKSFIYYILQLGYFKARRQFYIFNLQQVATDAQYVQHRYFPDSELTDLDIAEGTRLKQQGFILELLQYRVCGEGERRQMYEQAQQIAQISSRPIYVFRELMAYLSRERLIAPGYTVIQEMIGDVLQREKERLIGVAKSHLTEGGIAALNHLLTNPRGLYEITQIKREPKDFSLKEINREIRHGEQIKSLYAVAQTVLPRLEVSNESIKL